MGHIKEPTEFDFVINNRPLTMDEEIAIREYIYVLTETLMLNKKGLFQGLFPFTTN